MDGELPKKHALPAFWPTSFVERFDVLGTLGSSRISRAFLVRRRGGEEPLVADWYFSHKHAEASSSTFGSEISIVEAAQRGLVVPSWHGVCQDGSWLGVRGWVEEPLIIPGRAIPTEDLSRWLAQAALGLGYLHSLGLIHGYVRPDSIYLDEKQSLQMTLGPTFSLFQSVSSDADPDPMWSSPERLQGRPLSPSSDLYSLGMTFYKLATGKAPYSTSGPELIRQQVSQPVRSPLLHNPRLGLPIARILDRMLRKEPAERFSSANDLIETLNRLLGGTFPTELAEPSRPNLRPARWIEPPQATATLAELLERTQEGSVGMAILDGEAGTGKREFLQRMRTRVPEMTWVVGRASQPSDPFGALIAALSLLPGVTRPAILDQASSDIGSGSSSPGRIRQEVFRWASEQLGRHLPVVLQIDSAELLDLPSLDLLCHLLLRTGSGGLLVLLSQNRSAGPAPVQRFVARLGSVPVSWLSLSRLSAEQSADLVRSLMGDSYPRLEDFVFGLARGNPRATELVLHSLLATGDLQSRFGRWIFDAEAVSIQSISDAVACLVSRLSEPERTCLRAMEILRRPASSSELSALMNGEPSVASILAKLEGLRLISVQESRASIDFEELSRHLQDNWPADGLQDWHRQAYELLLARGASNEELAGHALGCDAKAAAARHLLRAADLRADLYDVASGAHLYSTALEHLRPEEIEMRQHAHSKLGYLYLLQGNTQAAESASRLALDLATKPEQRWALLEQLSRILIRGGEYDRALEALEDAFGLVPPGSALQVRTLAEKGWLCMRMGQVEPATQLIDQALEMAKASGDPGLLEMRHAYLGRLAWSRGEVKHALGHLISAVAVAEQQGQLDEVVIQSINLATLHSSLGNGTAVVELCEKVLRLTEQTGDLYEESRAWNLLGIHYSEQGLAARAITIYEKALEAAERLSNAIMMATVAINLGALYKDQGQLERGLSTLSRTVRQLGPCQNITVLAEARSCLADVKLSLGDLDGAEELIRSALELRRSMGHSRGQVMDLYRLGLIFEERQQFAQARKLYEEGRELTEGKPGSSFEPHTVLGIALSEILIQAGELDAARAILAEAEVSLDSHRLSWPSFLRWMARSKLDVGPEAIVAADRAIAVAEHLRYPELIAQAYAAAGEANLRAGNRLAAQRNYREAARAVHRLAGQIQDPALRQSYLDTWRRRQILQSSALLDAEAFA